MIRFRILISRNGAGLNFKRNSNDICLGAGARDGEAAGSIGGSELTAIPLPGTLRSIDATGRQWTTRN